MLGSRLLERNEPMTESVCDGKFELLSEGELWGLYDPILI